MKSINPESRRFRYPVEQKKEYEKLWMGGTSENRVSSNKQGIFKDLKDIFILSAVIGFQERKKRKPFKEGTNFTADFREYESIIYSIAICELSKDIDKNISKILRKRDGEDTIEDIIEEYANAGFEVLMEYIYSDESKSPLENIREYLLTFNKSEMEMFKELIL